MKPKLNSALVAAAGALVLCATAANADVLYGAYSYETGEQGLIGYNPTTLGEYPTHTTSPDIRGLVFGACCDASLNGGALFVAKQDDNVGALISRYDLGGNYLDTLNIGPFVDIGIMAYGAGTLFDAYESVLGGEFHVAWLDPDFGTLPTEITIGGKATGLVYGDNSLFVAWDGTIAEYDLSGNLLASQSYAYSVGPLAYGDGHLFAAANFFGSNGLLSFDPTDLSSYNVISNLNGEVNDLTFGDGALYAAFEHSVARYDTAGNELNSVDTGRRINNFLAFYSDAPQGGVPEPSAWALMILGFGLAGSAFRARRKAPAFEA